MIPNLIDATNDYFKQLNALQVAYERDEVSIEEVDARVQALMRELGQARRESLRAFSASLRHSLQTQWDAIAGVACVGALTYAWLAVH